MKPRGPSVAGSLQVTASALYLALVLVMLWAWLPGIRVLAARWLADAVYLHRLQVWGEEYARRPGWDRELRLVRGRAPAHKRRQGGRVPTVYTELEQGADGQ